MLSVKSDCPSSPHVGEYALCMCTYIGEQMMLTVFFL